MLLTAAHCVTDFGEVLTAGRLRVGLGHVARNQISDFYGVAGVDVHSGYDPFTSNETISRWCDSTAPRRMRRSA